MVSASIYVSSPPAFLTNTHDHSWCGNDAPTASAPSNDCNSPCGGAKSLSCGGSNRLSVVLDSTWKQRFFAAPAYKTWNLMGCYVDGTTGRLLANGVSLSDFGGASNATIGNCMSACLDKGYRYCGEEYYSECYGSNTAPDASKIATGADALKAGCNFPCSGNATEVSRIRFASMARIADGHFIRRAVAATRFWCTSTTARRLERWLSRLSTHTHTQTLLWLNDA